MRSVHGEGRIHLSHFKLRYTLHVQILVCTSSTFLVLPPPPPLSCCLPFLCFLLILVLTACSSLDSPRLPLQAPANDDPTRTTHLMKRANEANTWTRLAAKVSHNCAAWSLLTPTLPLHRLLGSITATTSPLCSCNFIDTRAQELWPPITLFVQMVQVSNQWPHTTTF